MSSSQFEPTVVVKTYEIYKTLYPLVLKFPKSQRYNLGQTLQTNLLDIIRLCFKANAMPRPLRVQPLVEAKARADLLKVLIRLSAELKLIQDTQYFQLISGLREVSKMLYGWIKHTRNTS